MLFLIQVQNSGSTFILIVCHYVQNDSEEQLIHLEAVHRVVKEAFQLWGMGVEHHQMVCSSPNIKYIIGRHLGAA